jgi:hypothetical protein
VICIVIVAVEFVTGWVDGIAKGARIEFQLHSGACDTICDSGMLSLMSVEESELAMASAYGGR